MLLSWTSGSMLHVVFPPSDSPYPHMIYFGSGIPNLYTKHGIYRPWLLSALATTIMTQLEKLIQCGLENLWWELCFNGQIFSLDWPFLYHLGIKSWVWELCSVYMPMTSRFTPNIFLACQGDELFMMPAFPQADISGKELFCLTKLQMATIPHMWQNWPLHWLSNVGLETHQAFTTPFSFPNKGLPTTCLWQLGLWRAFPINFLGLLLNPIKLWTFLGTRLSQGYLLHSRIKPSLSLGG